MSEIILCLFFAVWLILLSKIPCWSIRVIHHKCQDFNPFCCSVIFHYICHVFFIHSFIDGHLACFPLLAIIHNAAVNIKVHVSFFELVLWISSDKYLEMELLCCVVVLFVVFWEISILFSIVGAAMYNPTNSGWGFPFLYIFANTCLLVDFLQ